MPGGGRLWYTRSGDGPPLLLIQGTAATYRHWGCRLLSLLAESFQLVAYDHRGVGNSSPLDGSFTIAELADDAATLLDEIGWARVHVFGVSMGGVVAQELALRHPHRVASLILGGTSMGGQAPGASSTMPGLLTWAVVHGDALSTARNMFRLGVKDTNTVRPGAWAEYRDAATTPVHPHTTVLQMGAVARHSTADRLHHICAPTHVLHGDADRLVRIECGARLAAAIRDAQFTVLPAGHLFWLELPERTAELVSNFTSCGSTR